ncbi:MAG: hypothetical protein ACLTTP_01695 [Alistipes ihumii]
MIYFKTAEEIELLRENNRLVSATLAELAKHVRAGVTTLELDRIAEDFIQATEPFRDFWGTTVSRTRSAYRSTSRSCTGFPLPRSS